MDVGVPLDVEDVDQFTLHPVNGFEQPDASLLGVVISHPHQDHYGLAYRLPKETMFLIGKAAESILAAADIFTPAGVKLGNVMHLEDRTEIKLGPFTITPFLMDHSAYDAYAILVEADGRRLFYTGDLRAHGRKGALFERLVRHRPANVDVLLMEGTTLGRDGTKGGFPSEDDIEDRFVDLFKQTEGMPLVWCSGQNIDRLVTIFKACKRAGRRFIIDMYTAHILQATGNERLPQASWRGIKVFLPMAQKFRIIQGKEFELAASYRQSRIYPEQLGQAASNSVMLFRPSMMREIEEAGCLKGSVLICSIWSGYVHDQKTNQLHDWLQRNNIPLVKCHTSGHASVKDLVELRKAFHGAPVVPIHTEQADSFGELFGNVRSAVDGDWWEVKGG